MKSSLFSSLSATVIGIIFAALILLQLPITDNFIFVSKLFILLFSTLIIGFLFVFRSIRKQAFEILLTPYTMPLVAFGTAVLAATFFTNPSPVEGLLGMGGAYLSFVIIALLGPAIITRKQTSLLRTIFAGVVGLLIFLSALEFAPYSPALMLNSMFGISLPHSLLFNLSSSTLIALQLTVVAAVGVLAHTFSTKKLAASSALVLPILLIGVALFSWSLLPGKPAELTVPSFGSSWSVMLDALHSPRAALIGVGPASYGNAYLEFKPAWMNGTTNWALSFSQGANTPFTLITTLGFIGFAAWAWLVVRIFKAMRSAAPTLQSYYWMVAATIVVQLLAPPSVVMIGIQGILLAILIAAEKKQYPVLQLKALEAKVVRRTAQDESARKSLPISALIGGVFTLAILGVLTYLSGRAYAAHLMMGKAEVAAVANNGVAVYEDQMKAVELNPYLDTFRRNWANTNIVIAAALSNKTDATDEEKQQRDQLVQQAIREARSATILDPNDTQNWSMLAQIYSNLIGTVEQADQWAVQAYVQAITKNPNDPALRVALGGVFLGQKNYQQAASIFQQATQVKADYANAHYNLAMALKELQQYQDARNSFQTLLALIPEDTDDYKTIKKEVDDLDVILAEQAKNAAAQGEGDTTQQLGGQDGQSLQAPNPTLVDQNLPPVESSTPTEPVAPDPAALGN